MRSQLLVAGLLIMLMGASFYLLEIPLVFFWSLPFLIGGALMALASPLVSEKQADVEAPAGYRFCVFCSTPVLLGSDRCGHCNGVQPR